MLIAGKQWLESNYIEREIHEAPEAQKCIMGYEQSSAFPVYQDPMKAVEKRLFSRRFDSFQEFRPSGIFVLAIGELNWPEIAVAQLLVRSAIQHI
jgi:hypothetical protein